MVNKSKLVPFFNTLVDWGPYLILFVVYATVICAVISLFLVDIYTGKITSAHMVKNEAFGYFISFATTGFLIGAAACFNIAIQKKWDWKWIGFFGLVVVVVQGADMYFDAMSVDITRFGAIVNLAEVLTPAEATAHQIFRVLIALLSLVGEPVGTFAIMSFPLLKNLLQKIVKDAMPDNSSYHPNKPAYLNQPAKPSYAPFQPTPRVATAPRPKAAQAVRPAYKEPMYHSISKPPYAFDDDDEEEDEV